MERLRTPEPSSPEPSVGRTLPLSAVLGVLVVLQVAELALYWWTSPRCQQLVNALLLGVSVTGAGWLYLAWQEQIAALGEARRRGAQLQRAHRKLTGALLHDAKNQLTVIGAAISMLSAQRESTEALRLDEQQLLGLAREAQRRLRILLVDVEESDLDDCAGSPPRV